MNIRILLLSSYRSLTLHPLRSLLTTLGIIIGVVAIIAVTSIGQGAKSKVQNQIEKLGTNFIIVLGGQSRLFALQRGGAAQPTLKLSDYKAVSNECEGINQITPGCLYRGRCIVEGTNWLTNVSGVLPNYMSIRNWVIDQGDSFTESDVHSGNKVCVLGKTVALQLFGSNNPVGSSIRIKNLPFRVIGTLKEKGKRPDGTDDDDIIVAPFTTVQRKLLGIRKFSAMLISAQSKEYITKASQEIRRILRQRHHLSPDDDDDFTIFTQDDIAQASEAASRILNILLLIIASISLLVGGIGIMNIMLVTVAERKKEIGIRMALGATIFNIRLQFILEAITICLLGGAVGVGLGVGISKLIGYFFEWPIFIPVSSVIISFLSSTLIGLFFGYYPAYKASQLNPIEALIER